MASAFLHYVCIQVQTSVLLQQCSLIHSFTANQSFDLLYFNRVIYHYIHSLTHSLPNHHDVRKSSSRCVSLGPVCRTIIRQPASSLHQHHFNFSLTWSISSYLFNFSGGTCPILSGAPKVAGEMFLTQTYMYEHHAPANHAYSILSLLHWDHSMGP